MVTVIASVLAFVFLAAMVVCVVQILGSGPRNRREIKRTLAKRRAQLRS